MVLTLIGRQGQLENRRTDLMFRDKMGWLLLVELEKEIVLYEHVNQIEDYIKLKKSDNGGLRGMLIGQVMSPFIQTISEQKNIEWKEIAVEHSFTYLQNKNSELLVQTFFLINYQERQKKLK